MTLDEIWTTGGLLRRDGVRGVALRHPLWIQPLPATPDGLTEAEGGGAGGNANPNATGSAPADVASMQAGLVEVACRLGLECLFLPQPVWGQVFCEHPPRDALPTDGVGAVIGWSRDWLVAVLTTLGREARAFVQEYDRLGPQEGLLWVADAAGPQHAERDLLVVASQTGVGLLAALRALASDNGGQGFPATRQCVVRAAAPGLPTRGPDGVPPSNPRSIRPPAADERPNRRGLRLFDVFSNLDATSGATGVLPEADVQFDLSEPIAVLPELLELAARVGLACSHARFPFAVAPSEVPRPSALQIAVSVEGSQLHAEAVLDEQRLRFTAPTAESLREMVRDVVRSWFDPPDDVQPSDWRGGLAALASPAPDIRQRARAEAALESVHADVGVASVTVPAQLRKAVAAWCDAAGVPVEMQRDAEPFCLAWRGETGWERMRGSLEAELRRQLQSPPSTETIRVEVFTTAPEETFRAEMQALLQPLLGPASCSSERAADRFAARVEFVYRHITKAGLDWFMADVLPELKRNPQVASVEVAARAVPGGVMALPHRHLQEFFPVDAIIERETALSSDDVTLRLSAADGPMYTVTARDATGAVVRVWTWESLVERRRYMPGEAACVLVPAAGYRMQRVDPDTGTAQLLRTHTIPTVYSQFWDWYQNTVLPAVTHMPAHLAAPTRFARLEAEVWVNGAEWRCGVYEEAVSWPEALHEDLYFYTLHALRKHAEDTGEDAWKTPGLVVPLVHIGPGAPRAEVRWTADAASRIAVRGRAGERIEIDCAQVPPPVDPACIRRAIYADGTWTAVAPDDGAHDASGGESWLAWVNGLSRVHHTPSPVVESPLDPPGRPVPSSDAEPRILQNNDVIRWLNEMGPHLPGRHFVVDWSFQGRPVVAVELFEQRPGCMTSRCKQALFKPTWLVLARHHANEVSSTNAAVQLIRQVMDQPEWLQQVNLVVVPVHNVDGAALHRDLAAEHPYWKHHAARFNACGYEFGRDYFQPATPFGESRVAARLWDLWRPDIVLDDHGIPSHEWIQPFSGYNSPPSFPVSYWIPHAQIYTIWRELQPDAPVVPGGLIDTVSQTLDADAAIRERNAVFLRRYAKWGNAFSPDQFPITTVDGVITYRWQARPSETATNFIERYPGWVTADIVTEVNDETVHGEALREVAHAHSQAHAGILAWLMRAEVVVTHHVEADASGRSGCVGLERIRPLASG
ncbi:MAG: hypothetical protein K6T78_13325 [Alicyclobacillus sp.]|nr:hypothetical protein [Alicyclobacillus sp.]